MMWWMGVWEGGEVYDEEYVFCCIAWGVFFCVGCIWCIWCLGSF